MIFKLFSQRQREATQAGQEDVYQYSVIPSKLRMQIQQILADAIGPQITDQSYAVYTPEHNPEAWRHINKVLCRELGRHQLIDRPYASEFEIVLNFMGQSSADEFVDSVEVCCRIIDVPIRNAGEYQRTQWGVSQDPQSALDEINYRLKESGVGFAYTGGQIIRMDSEYTHEIIVKPALRLLSSKKYQGAQEEFAQAHRHYREGQFEQSIVYAAKALESTLKSVCDKKRWEYQKGARVSDLLKVVKSHGLWPEYMDHSFQQLLATLASGLPRIRDDTAAHGQGSQPREVPEYIASYSLNLCASKIALIASAAGQ